MFRRHSVFALLLVLALPAAAGVYKWVDENGKVQYSDKPPQQQNQKGLTELNKQGMTVRQTEGILTPEQRAARELEIARQREASQQKEDARRRDKALVNSFTRTSEIDAIRDRNLEQVAAGIQSDKMRREAVQKRLDGYQAQVDKLSKAGKPVPDDLKSDMKERKAEIAKIDEQIKQRENDAVQLKERAEADKKRLIELRGADAGK